MCDGLFRIGQHPAMWGTLGHINLLFRDSRPLHDEPAGIEGHAANCTFPPVDDTVLQEITQMR